MTTHDDLVQLRERHPAWRLLRADNAPLIIGFLGRVFVDDNVRAISQTELVSQLDDELYALRGQLGERAYPKSAAAYVSDWAAPEAGWLRLHYLEGKRRALRRRDARAREGRRLGREPPGTHLRRHRVAGCTPSWDCSGRSSRAATPTPNGGSRSCAPSAIDSTPRSRAAESGADRRPRPHRRSATATSSSRARPASCSRDFREVEVKFRALDRADARDHRRPGTAPRASCSTSSSATATPSPTPTRAAASRRSTTSCCLPSGRTSWPSCSTRSTTSSRSSPTTGSAASTATGSSPADRTQSTVRTLSDQLRRFLDDSVWLENRRVVELLRSIEGSSVALRDVPDARPDDGARRDPPRGRAALRAAALRAAGPGPDRQHRSRRPTRPPRPPPSSPSTTSTSSGSSARSAPRCATVGRSASASSSRSTRPSTVSPRSWRGSRIAADGIDLVFDDDSRQQVSWTADDDTERRADVPTVLYVRHDASRPARSPDPDAPDPGRSS